MKIFAVYLYERTDNTCAHLLANRIPNNPATVRAAVRLCHCTRGVNPVFIARPIAFSGDEALSQ